MKNKIKKYSIAGIGLATTAYTMLATLAAHAAFEYSSSTAATDNGGFLQTFFDLIINFFKTTGGVLFLVSVLVLVIVIGWIRWGGAKAGHAGR